MRRILVHFDTDPQPSVFDRVVAIDSDVEQLFSYGGVTPETLTGLVHGAMFTRGPDHLKNTAVFIGGSNVALGEQLFEQVQQTFFGPIRVSVMMDSNGSNTTAAAAVLTAAKHQQLSGQRVVVLAGTGPVGLRVAQLLAAEGAIVQLCSRTLNRAQSAAIEVQRLVSNAAVDPRATSSMSETLAACKKAPIVIAAGAAGIELLSMETRRQLPDLKLMIDLNAVPPVGIAGVEVTDRAVMRDGVLAYGAIGVGGLKMKIHKAAIRSLFESNDQVLDTMAIYELGKSLV